MAGTSPTLRLERELLRSDPSARLLGGLDEVGRGALAGPVTVGLVVVGLDTRTAPAGVRDSKLLTPAARTRLDPALRRWGVARAVGHASPGEIDDLGIIAALRLAAHRALDVVTAAGARPDLLLLDGSHDWFTDPSRVGLLAALDDPADADPPVVTRVKADMRCASVAAASVIAKVERDAVMAQLATDPALEPYGLGVNKGYSAPGHLAALRALGPTDHHRRSWRLPERATGSDTGGGAGSRPALGHNGPDHDDREHRE